MKILVVTHDSNFSGGANRSLFSVITDLVNKYNVEVEVLLPKSKGKLNDKLDEIGVKWVSAKYFGVVSGIRNDGKDFLRKCKVKIGYYIEKIQAKILYKKFKNKGLDFVYTNTRLPMIGANIAKYLNIPHVIHVREFGTVKPLWGKWSYKDIYRMSDKIILISEALKQDFDKHIPSDKSIVIHNGVSYEESGFKEKKFDDLIQICIVGRLVPDKAQEEAINAINYIIKNKLTNRKLILNIIGSSPKRSHLNWYAEKLYKKVDELGLNNNVIFHGEISDTKKIRESMNIELVCSICETFGRVTVEAMRSSLYVIGTNTGGTPEIIEDGITGVLYKQGDFIDLANKILQAISDENEYNLVRKNGYNSCLDNFTMSKNVKQIFDVFSSLEKNERKDKI
ncbi:MAG: glycosyltransferase family 4 protein [Bacilli bacterium]|jgi:glycosyltransferase involved in cell wall biosynthesis|nr:glycosyltransferase family 4 protein [Bacilli bacterium]